MLSCYDRIDALMMLLTGVVGGTQRMTVDELRKNIEAIGPDAYDKMTYYERWIVSVTQTILQRGLVYLRPQRRHRAMVLPLRPAGTEGWSEDQLAGLVTRDSLIGVKTANTP